LKINPFLCPFLIKRGGRDWMCVCKYRAAGNAKGVAGQRKDIFKE
jgi:hypothetical protein